MQSHSIRQAYLDYFKQEGHTIVDSSSWCRMVNLAVHQFWDGNCKRRLPYMRIEATRKYVMSAIFVPVGNTMI